MHPITISTELEQGICVKRMMVASFFKNQNFSSNAPVLIQLYDSVIYIYYMYIQNMCILTRKLYQV